MVHIAANGPGPATGPRRTKSGFTLARPFWVIPATVFMFGFFLLPLLHNAVRSVLEEEAVGDPVFYYRKLLIDPFYRSVLFETLTLSFFVTLICLVLSYPVALFLVRHAGRWRSLIIFCLIAPLLTSVIMRTVGIQLILARRGALNALLASLDLPTFSGTLSTGPFAVYVGMIQVLIPFMVLSIAPVIQRIDPTLEEAAAVIGAGRLVSFLNVTLPLSREGILTGCILVFMMANGSFVTQLLLGGGKMTTMPVLIFQQFSVTQDTAFAGAMGNTLLVLCLACLAIQFALVSRRTRQ